MALYNGLEATLWRHAMWNGGYFGCIQGVKSAIPEAEVRYGTFDKVLTFKKKMNDTYCLFSWH